MKPNPNKHNPSPDHLRELVSRAGLSQRAAARAIGVSERTMRHWLAGTRTCPYSAQFALESLSSNRGKAK